METTTRAGHHRKAPAHQMVELALDGGEVVKDISVVEFQVVQYRGAGAVVHELAAFVEEGGVVFVGFNDE